MHAENGKKHQFGFRVLAKLLLDNRRPPDVSGRVILNLASYRTSVTTNTLRQID